MPRPELHAHVLAVLERLDAQLSETDDEGRLLTFGKVAGVAVVGNEDLDETPERTAGTTEVLARHATHLARLLKGSAYPAGG